VIDLKTKHLVQFSSALNAFNLTWVSPLAQIPWSWLEVLTSKGDANEAGCHIRNVQGNGAERQNGVEGLQPPIHIGISPVQA
jgi:hypothetical protein